MEADWDEITRVAVPSSGLHAIHAPASSIVFDDLQELLWVGNDQVRHLRCFLVAHTNLFIRDESHRSMGLSFKDMSQSRRILERARSNSYWFTKKGSFPFPLQVFIS